MSPSVYIVVLNWNGYDNTKKCIDSLQQIDFDNYKIVIVDNDSSDGSYEKIVRDYSNIYTVLRSDSNLGYSGGMNIGIKYALSSYADYILIANNDLLFEPNFLKPMVILAESNSRIGIVSAKVFYMHDKEKLYCAGGYMSRWKCVGVAKNQGSKATNTDSLTYKIDFAEGCMFLAKAEVFRKVGFLSEDYFMYYEDVDFSLRVAQFFDIYYCGDSVIYHKAGAGVSWHAYSSLYHYYFTRNRFLVFKKSSITYRSYVALYSFMNVLAKTIIVLFKRDKNYKKSIMALLSGFKDGFIGILH